MRDCSVGLENRESNTIQKGQTTQEAFFFSSVSPSGAGLAVSG